MSKLDLKSDPIAASLDHQDSSIRKKGLLAVLTERRVDLMEKVRSFALKEKDEALSVLAVQVFMALEAAPPISELDRDLDRILSRPDGLPKITQKGWNYLAASGRKSLVLKALSLMETYPPGDSFRFIESCLKHVDPEVRAKACLPAVFTFDPFLFSYVLTLTCESDENISARAFEAIDQVPKHDLGFIIERAVRANDQWVLKSLSPFLPVLACEEIEDLLNRLVNQKISLGFTQKAKEAVARLQKIRESKPPPPPPPPPPQPKIDFSAFGPNLDLPGPDKFFEEFKKAQAAAGPGLPPIQAGFPPLPKETPLGSATNGLFQPGQAIPQKPPIFAKEPVKPELSKPEPPKPLPQKGAKDANKLDIVQPVPQPMQPGPVVSSPKAEVPQMAPAVAQPRLPAASSTAAVPIKPVVSEAPSKPPLPPVPPVAVPHQVPVQQAAPSPPVAVGTAANLPPAAEKQASPKEEISKTAAVAAPKISPQTAPNAVSASGIVPPPGQVVKPETPKIEPPKPPLPPQPVKAEVSTKIEKPEPKVAAPAVPPPPPPPQATAPAPPSSGTPLTIPKSAIIESIISRYPLFITSHFSTFFQPAPATEHLNELKVLLSSLVAFLNFTFLQTYLFYATRVQKVDQILMECLKSNLLGETPLRYFHNFAMAIKGVKGTDNFFTFPLARAVTESQSESNPLILLKEIYEFAFNQAEDLDENIPQAVGGLSQALVPLKGLMQNRIVLKTQPGAREPYIDLTGPTPGPLSVADRPSLDLPPSEMFVISKDRSEALGLFPFFSFSGKEMIYAKPEPENFKTLLERLELK